jgi:hypothetical protein
MEDEVRPVDEDDETGESTEESGPLGRLLEQSTSSSAAESPVRPQVSTNRPSEPATASTDYAEGTREHDDDRGE